MSRLHRRNTQCGLRLGGPRLGGSVRRQRGAVLIVSLVMLVALTLIGLTSMNQSTMEERMSANMQRSVQAFQTAESSLKAAFADAETWDIAGMAPKSATVDKAKANDNEPTEAVTFEYGSEFQAWTPPPADSLWSPLNFQSAHFKLTGNSPDFDQLAVRVAAGAYQVVPK